MSNAFECAVGLLARREHGAHELQSKLKQKGHADTAIDEALVKCQDLGLQSDERFIESRCRLRIRQGYGPLRIRQELRHLKLDVALIEAALEAERDRWFAHALDVWKKKYRGQQASSFAEQQKQKQFLLYRGFSTDIIASIFNHH